MFCLEKKIKGKKGGEKRKKENDKTHMFEQSLQSNPFL